MVSSRTPTAQSSVVPVHLHVVVLGLGRSKQLTEGQQMRCHQFRFLLSLQYSLPKAASFHLVTELILVDQHLAYIDFLPFPQLTNSSWAATSSPHSKTADSPTAPTSACSNVRSNRLRDLAEVIDLIVSLPVLEYIGAKDNKWLIYRWPSIATTDTGHSEQALGHEHRIRFIDDSSIGADELVRVAQGDGRDQREREELFRFNELIKHKDLTNLTHSRHLQRADYARQSSTASRTCAASTAAPEQFHGRVAYGEWVGSVVWSWSGWT